MLAADVRENAHQRDEALHLVQKITTQTDRCGLYRSRPRRSARPAPGGGTPASFHQARARLREGRSSGDTLHRAGAELRSPTSGFVKPNRVKLGLIVEALNECTRQVRTFFIREPEQLRFEDFTGHRCTLGSGHSKSIVSAVFR